MDTDEGKLALLKYIIQLVGAGHVIQVLIAIVIVNVPSLLAFFSEWRTARKIDKLQNARLADKDAEIKRLAGRIKELENLTLKNKRS